MLGKSIFAKTLLAITLGAAACSAFAQETLRVGTEAEFAPFEFHSADGKLQGFDIDIMEAVAKQMGVKVEWVQMSFDGIIPAMLTKQVDMAVASFTITDERKKRIDFADPYYEAGLTFVVRDADAKKYVHANDLKGKKICAQLGSASAILGEKFSPGKVATFNDAPSAYLELKNHGCEAVLNDRPVNLYMMGHTKAGANLVEIDEIMEKADMGFAMPKDNKELTERVNAALKAIKENGEYQKISDKWFASKNKPH